jgi:ABC-2 type transport system ATP-binding protein
MSEEILKCNGIYKDIHGKAIIKDVTFDIKEGEILGFIGPNGAGKTTTIKLILGLQKITKGNIQINGYDVEKNFEKAIQKVGSIVENPDLYMYMSGYANLKLVANLYESVDKKRIDEVVKLVGLENRIKDKVSKYSLGMRQRLGIAQAILHKPNLLILDEPTNGLDPEGIKQVRELIVKLSKEEKMAIMISSHNLSEIENVCNRICIIKNGVVVEESNIEDLKKETSNNEYIMEVDKPNAIKEIIQKNVQINNNKVTIEAEREEIPEIVNKLVENKIKLYSITENTLSLEDAFLKKTGGNVIE